MRPSAGSISDGNKKRMADRSVLDVVGLGAVFYEVKERSCTAAGCAGCRLRWLRPCRHILMALRR